MQTVASIELQAQILKSLRGSLSQEQFARRLGFKTSQIVRWENKHSKISWDAFVWICKKTGANLPEAMKKILFFDSTSPSANLLLKHLWKDIDYGMVRSKTGFSKSKISRLLNEKGKISLVDIFMSIEAMSFSLDSFIENLLEERPIPNIILKAQKYNRDLIQLIYHRPWIAALLRILETKQYQNSKENSYTYLSRFLNLTEDEVKSAISDLLKFKHIVKTDDKYQTLNTNLLGQSDRRGEISIRKFWTEKILQLADQIYQDPKALQGSLIWSYQILSVSPKARKEIENKIGKLFSDIDKIVQNDQQPAEEILLYNLQLLEIERLFR